MQIKEDNIRNTSESEYCTHDFTDSPASLNQDFPDIHGLFMENDKDRHILYLIKKE